MFFEEKTKLFHYLENNEAHSPLTCDGNFVLLPLGCDNLPSSLKANLNKSNLEYKELLLCQSDNTFSNGFRVLLIHNISKKLSIRLGEKCKQQIIIYKNDEGSKEICTTPFTKYDNRELKEVNVGETVRTLTSANKVYLTKDIKELLLSYYQNQNNGKNTYVHTSNTCLYAVERPKSTYFHTNKDVRYISLDRYTNNHKERFFAIISACADESLDENHNESYEKNTLILQSILKKLGLTYQKVSVGFNVQFVVWNTAYTLEQFQQVILKLGILFKQKNVYIGHRLTEGNEDKKAKYEISVWETNSLRNIHYDKTNSFTSNSLKDALNISPIEALKENIHLASSESLMGAYKREKLMKSLLETTSLLDIPTALITKPLSFNFLKS